MDREYDIYCVGFKRVYYPGTVAGAEAFEYTDAECVKDILCCYIDENGQNRRKFEIELETLNDWCGSGYCGASMGSMGTEHVYSFGPLTHVPKSHRPIKIEGASYIESSDGHGDGTFVFWNTNEHNGDDWWLDDYEVSNNVFYCDYDGGDSYYPRGSAGVNEELFEELPRAFERRPVYIFRGESAVGKSTLAHLLEKDKQVYETDSAKDGTLPDELWYDVIVMGNKWPNITLDDIRKRIVDEAEIIIVDFSRI